MTEQYGFGKELQSSIQNIEQSMRRTGRTTRMLEALKDGDRVVTYSEASASYLRQLIRERGLNVNVRVCEPTPGALADMERVKASDGETVFDHTWIYMYYRAALDGASAMLNRRAVQLSGWSEAHEETRRLAIHAKIMDPATPMNEAAELQDQMTKERKFYSEDGKEVQTPITYRGT